MDNYETLVESPARHGDLTGSNRKRKAYEDLTRFEEQTLTAPLPLDGRKRTRQIEEPMKGSLAVAGCSEKLLLRFASQTCEQQLSHLSDFLEHLDRSQMKDILLSLASKYPGLPEQIVTLIPRPSLEWVFDQLSQAEIALQQSFPYNRNGPDRSDYAFHRVKPHLMKVQDTMFRYLEFFTMPESYPVNLQHEYPSMALTYLNFVTKLVHRLPTWENEDRNQETKVYYYETLSRYWRSTISELGNRSKSSGRVFGPMFVQEWMENLHLNSIEVEGAFGFDDVLQEFRQHFGWMSSGGV